MLINNESVVQSIVEDNNQKYNVIVNGVIKRSNVAKFIAESYIRTLSSSEQSQTSIVPVTNDGKEILFG